MKITVLCVMLVSLCTNALHGQASATASRAFDLQVGGGLTLVNSDYYPQRFRGGALYTTLDFKPHFGAEFDFRLAKAQQDPTYEKTYELGARYHREYGRLAPYGKVMYGRGVFNYVNDTYDAKGNVLASVVTANLAYNEFVFGGGVDLRVLRFLNVRGDYEYQMWHSFPVNGLTPQALTIGVAYHFPGGLQKGRHF